MNRRWSNHWSGVLCVLLTLVSADPAPAVVLTFADLPEPAESGTSQPLQSLGIPSGGQAGSGSIQATLSGFESYLAESFTDVSGEGRALKGGALEQPSTITFGSPVRVPSMYVSNFLAWDFNFEVVGYRDGVEEFRFAADRMYVGPPAHEYYVRLDADFGYAGAGHTVDRLEFTNFYDAYIDNLEVVPVPEPTAVVTIGATLLLAATSRGRGRRARRAVSPPGTRPAAAPAAASPN